LARLEWLSNSDSEREGLMARSKSGSADEPAEVDVQEAEVDEGSETSSTRQ
jgi:hypothetical protein